MKTLPKLAELYTNVRTDLDYEYGVNISVAKKVALRAIAFVHAGKLWLIYKVIAFVQKQIWPDTADTAANGGTLERFGLTRLGRNPKAAVAGQYTVQVLGIIGATVPAQTVYKSDDTSLNPGFLFILDADHSIVSSPDTILLRALTPGIEAKLNVGDTLTSTSPIANVIKTATVTIESVQPLAAETTEEYRTAILDSFRLEPQGGSPADYRLWCLDAQGVLRVYPYPKSGETNAVNVFVEAKLADSTDGKGTPSGLIITDVTNVINFNPDVTLSLFERGRKPATVVLYVLPITLVNIEITLNGSSFTVTQKALILQALTDAITNIRPFVSAADIPQNQNDTIDIFKVSGIIYAQIPNAIYTGVVLKANGVSVTSYTFIDGNIPTLLPIVYL